MFDFEFSHLPFYPAPPGSDGACAFRNLILGYYFALSVASLRYREFSGPLLGQTGVVMERARHGPGKWWPVFAEPDFDAFSYPFCPDYTRPYSFLIRSGRGGSSQLPAPSGLKLRDQKYRCGFRIAHRRLFLCSGPRSERIRFSKNYERSSSDSPQLQSPVGIASTSVCLATLSLLPAYASCAVAFLADGKGRFRGKKNYSNLAKKYESRKSCLIPHTRQKRDPTRSTWWDVNPIL